MEDFKFFVENADGTFTVRLAGRVSGSKLNDARIQILRDMDVDISRLEVYGPSFCTDSVLANFIEKRGQVLREVYLNGDVGSETARMALSKSRRRVEIFGYVGQSALSLASGVKIERLAFGPGVTDQNIAALIAEAGESLKTFGTWDASISDKTYDALTQAKNLETLNLLHIDYNRLASIKSIKEWNFPEVVTVIINCDQATYDALKFVSVSDCKKMLKLKTITLVPPAK
jgi:hypothetical protein